MRSKHRVGFVGKTTQRQPLSTDELIENIEIGLEWIDSSILYVFRLMLFQTGLISILLALILWRVW